MPSRIMDSIRESKFLTLAFPKLALVFFLSSLCYYVADLVSDGFTWQSAINAFVSACMIVGSVLVIKHLRPNPSGQGTDL